ncbi:MAG: hypothetical protein CMH54_10015 [Myxococcales bacterium]|nr:hypothetical protein [Myxococcales bacterium]
MCRPLGTGLAVVFCLLANPSVAGESRTCLPWSVLATQPDFATELHGLHDLARLCAELNGTEEVGADVDEKRTSLQEVAGKTGVLALEARCCLARLDRNPLSNRTVWENLGLLRTESLGLDVLVDRAQLVDGLDVVVRLPKTGQWPEVATGLASLAFGNLPIDESVTGPSDESLQLATKMWPSVAHTWLKAHRAEHGEKPRLRKVMEWLNLTPGMNENTGVSGIGSVLLFLPTGVRYKQISAGVRNFLRLVSVKNSLSEWIMLAPEDGELDARIAELQVTGYTADPVIGPLVRTDLGRWPDPTKSFTWVARHGVGASGALRLGPGVKEELLAHAKAFGVENGEETIPEPIVVVGPPGKRLERWSTELRGLLGPDARVTTLAHAADEQNLTAYAEMVKAQQPETVIVVSSGQHIDRIFRYLAHVGIRGRRGGKTVHEGDYHPYIIVPGSISHDPSMVRRNKNYLDGVRLSTDIAPTHSWQSHPLLKLYIDTYQAYPPVYGIRVAALIERLDSVRNGSDIRQLEGKTSFGVVESHNDTLTFPMLTYIFAGRRFRQTPTR